jgi:osmoprotectant transport system ATP-binding protein
MIQLRGVSKRYGDALALRPTDLALDRGRTYVLIGPSGCGKSTLLRLMMHLIRPDSGEVLFGDEPVSAANIQAIRHRIGYVIQDGGLFPHLTARQNVALAATYLGWTPAKMEKRIEQLASLTHFPADGLDRYPGQLSGGQRQRVSLMRALALDPDVLLLDEPLGALDPMIRAELQQELREIFRSLGKTVVLVTHDLTEAAYFADTIVLLRDGCIVQQGTAQDLSERPAEPFVTKFVEAQRGVREIVDA